MNIPSHGRLRRTEASRYLEDTHGVEIKPSTLAKMATVGGGPAMTYSGRIPLYDVLNLDRWAAERLSKPVGSTSERKSA